ncbi:EamA family transporter [Candidatus Saccharibacteria bacterium]|nr:EamA family transporter [Candidatus Saccharibacteria bacterium]
MTDAIVVAILSGLAGMLGWGLADFFAKKTIDIVGDLATLAWAHIYGVIFLLSIVLIYNRSEHQTLTLPNGFKEFALLGFFGILQAFVYFFAYRAFGKGKLALLNPVFSSYSGIVVLLSTIFFAEVIGVNQLLCLLVIFAGIMSISLDRESLALKKIRLAKISGMKEILIAAILGAVWTVLWGNFVIDKDWLVYAAIMYIFMTITILLICLIQRLKLNVLNAHTWKFFMLIGVSEVIAYVGVSLGYSVTSRTSIIAVLSAAFSVPTVILAHIFLKERITKFQISGVALVITGVVAITLV